MWNTLHDVIFNLQSFLCVVTCPMTRLYVRHTAWCRITQVVSHTHTYTHTHTHTHTRTRTHTHPHPHTHTSSLSLSLSLSHTHTRTHTHLSEALDVYSATIHVCVTHICVCGQRRRSVWLRYVLRGLGRWSPLSKRCVFGHPVYRFMYVHFRYLCIHVFEYLFILI